MEIPERYSSFSQLKQKEFNKVFRAKCQARKKKISLFSPILGGLRAFVLAPLSIDLNAG